jgi:hypothetical protein
VIIALDTPQDLDECAKQLGGIEVMQLFTPLTRRRPQKPDDQFAIDNGAFAKFDAHGFRCLLRTHEPRKQHCRFVAVPDVVGDARRTLEVFRAWSQRDELAGWPLAYVCQDGAEHLPIPWGRIAAIFIGGSTEWKMGGAATACVKAARALEKWVHVGRINTPARYEYFRDMGADSCDGTGLARYDHMREAIHREMTEPKLQFA